MSGFTEKQRLRVEQLTGYAKGLINGRNGSALLEEYKISETSFLPGDVLELFDNLFDGEIELEKIKTASNKLFNILNEKLSEYKKYDYSGKSVIRRLIEDNDSVKKHLAGMRTALKKINKEIDSDIISELIPAFESLGRYTVHYTVMENILFPEIEKSWTHHQCLKLMWSFHDDIRKNIKSILGILKSRQFDLAAFNRVCGKIYFSINTIIFREENILFPIMVETMESEVFDSMTTQLHGFKLEFAGSESGGKIPEAAKAGINMNNDGTVKFSTGELSTEQLELMLNRLPVDITFVDENDRVRYFSSPQDRLFPRTTGIIGRSVQDCHPHESAEVVNRIVASFKSGAEDDASFWLKMGKKYVLIKYFALRDENGNYRGVLEVSQEISDIRKIEGEQRLLDWKN